MNRERKVIYVAGPYTAPTEERRDFNVERAKESAQLLGEMGWLPICPHTMTHNWENESDMTYDDYMCLSIALLLSADAVYMLPGWKDSYGATTEYHIAKYYGIPIYQTLAEAQRAVT